MDVRMLLTKLHQQMPHICHPKGRFLVLNWPVNYDFNWAVKLWRVSGSTNRWSNVS